MSGKLPKKLPKLPYGQGSFTWANEEHTNIKFQKLYTNKFDKSDKPRKKRLIVYGRSISECYERMSEKERLENSQNKAVYKASIFNKNVILSSAMYDWLKKSKYQKTKANSYDRNECTIKNQIEYYDIGLKPVIEIETKDIAEHIHYLQYEHNGGKGYSYSTVKKAYEILDQFFAYYYQKNPTDNPMLGVIRPVQRKEVGEITLEDASTPTEIKDLVLSDEEIKTFKAACYEQPQNGRIGGTKYGVALYFILVTFLRIGEATALTWSDIDFENKILRVTKAVSRVRNRDNSAKAKTKVILTKPKTVKSMREVALTDEAIEALNHIKDHSNFTAPTDYVLATQKGTKVLEQNLLRVLKGKLKSCGLNKNGERDKFTLHFLRHTGISYYLRHGVSLDVISQMAGHASTAITIQTYYHVIKSQKEEALKQMNSIG